MSGWLRSVRLRHRILLLVLAVVTGTLTASLAVLEVGVRDHIFQRTRQELARSMSVLLRSELKEGQALTVTALAAGNHSSLNRLAQLRQVAPLASFLRSAQRSSGNSLGVVSDHQGLPWCVTDDGLKGRPELQHLTTVQTALQGTPARAYLELDSQLYQLASVPIESGVLTLGRRLESKDLLELTGDRQLLVAILDGDRVLLQSSGCPPELVPAFRRLQQERPLQRGDLQAVEEMDIEGKSGNFLGLAAPFGTSGERSLVLLQNTAPVLDFMRQIRWSLFHVGCAALGLSALLSLPVAGRLANPAELAQRGVETLGDGYIQVDGDFTIENLNPEAERLLEIRGPVRGRSLFEVVELGGPSGQPLTREGLRISLQSGHPVRQERAQAVRKSTGGTFSCAFVLAPMGPQGAVLLFRDITDMTALQQQLLDLSHFAGMAEVATGVLHNVGNALTSVTVSAHLVGEKLQQERSPALRQVADWLEMPPEQLLSFLESDPRGQKLGPYLRSLADSLKEQHKALLSEVADLTTGLEHVQNVIRLQQDFARGSAYRESLSLEALLEQAMQMSLAAHPRLDLEIVRDFARLPAVLVEKHRVLQILVNLTSNALDALQGRERPRLILRTVKGSEGVRVEVEDNGVGIDSQALGKIFSHGFTTKPHGHGFGLHNCALAARALGGRLEVSSPGPDQGAVFSLELPQP